MTIPALATLFRGPLESFAGRLTLSDAIGSRAGADLLDAPALKDLIDRLALRHGDGDRRAVASIWSKHHFSAVMPATLAANLVLDLDLPVALTNVRIVADAVGVTRSLVLPHGGAPLRDDGDRRFDGLIDDHVEPLIATLSAVSGASTKVFWSNAGNIFDYIVREAAATGLGRRPGIDAGMALMTQKRRSGRANPLFEPVTYPDGGRLRRLCCIRYLAPDVGYCGTCPITPERRGAATPSIPTRTRP